LTKYWGKVDQISAKVDQVLEKLTKSKQKWTITCRFAIFGHTIHRSVMTAKVFFRDGLHPPPGSAMAGIWRR